MYVYLITNLINDKIYIGLSTKTVEESTNYYGSGNNIDLALKKYGKANFTKEILARDIDDKKLLAQLEIDFIKEYNSTDRNIGYNISPGGDLQPDSCRVAVYKYTIEGELVKYYSTMEAAIEEASDKNIHRKASREFRPIKGFWYSKVPLTKDEVVQKHKDYLERRSLAFKNGAAKRYADPKLAKFYKANMAKARAAVTNYSTSEATKQKLSAAFKGRHWYYNPENPDERIMCYTPPEGWLKGKGAKIYRPSGLVYKNSKKSKEK